MKAESKRSVRIMLQWLLSAATVLMAALLIWQCVTIYHEGIAPKTGCGFTIFTAGKLSRRTSP